MNRGRGETKKGSTLDRRRRDHEASGRSDKSYQKKRQRQLSKRNSDNSKLALDVWGAATKGKVS